MGAGASTASSSQQQHEAVPQKKAKPSRVIATKGSLQLAADILRQGLEAQQISVSVDGEKKPRYKNVGFLWGDPQGLVCGKYNHGKAAVRIEWKEEIKFSASKDTLIISQQNEEWRIQLLKRPHVVNWLSCYLYAFLPPTPREYTVTFTEWGRLGISFAMYMDTVIPIVFTVNEPAASLGVIPGSVLLSLNDTKIVDLAEDDNMLNFITNAPFPKVCKFVRPKLPMERLSSFFQSKSATSGSRPTSHPTTGRKRHPEDSSESSPAPDSLREPSSDNATAHTSTQEDATTTTESLKDNLLHDELPAEIKEEQPAAARVPPLTTEEEATHSPVAKLPTLPRKVSRLPPISLSAQ